MRPYPLTDCLLRAILAEAGTVMSGLTFITGTSAEM